MAKLNNNSIQHFQKIFKIAGGISIFCIFAIFLLFYYASTEQGAKNITEIVLDNLIDAQEMTIEKQEGTFQNGLVFKNLEFKDLNGLPAGSSLKIQELKTQFHSLNIEDVFAEVLNARLVLSVSEPILIQGKYKNNELNFNIYSKSIDVQEILKLVPDVKIPKGISGTISDVDLNVKGTSAEPLLNGQCTILKASYENFVLAEIPLKISLKTKGSKSNMQLLGEILIENGVLLTKTSKIEFEQSRLDFDGDPQNPVFAVNAQSSVGRIKIKIKLKGTRLQPDLQLASEPPFPEQRLMVMLVTGKAWSGAEEALESKQASAALTNDFIDYFILGGSGERLARQLGIKDFQVSVDKDKKGVSVLKELNESVDVGYGVEETQRQDKNGKDIKQKVEGDLKVTENLSISAQKELKEQKTTLDKQTQSELPDDKLLLKYQKKF